MAVDEGEFLSQVDRILHSEELRSSETQRRLFRFLADKSRLGEADGLNEYAVATDGLGKPQSYDPRHNSAVRIQVGRLRQSIAEYYRGEGKQDDLIIELPKGRFKLACNPRSASVEPPLASSTARAEQIGKRDPATNSWIRVLLTSAVFSSLLFGLYFLAVQRRGHTADASTFLGWTSDLQELWGPLSTQSCR